MPLTKLINGKRVALTADEEEAARAEWNAGPTPGEWRARIASTRYEHEIKGATFSHSDGNAYAIATDRQSQAMVSGTRLALEDDPDLTVRWKTQQGFVTCGPNDIKALASAVRTHVQSAFNREDDLVAMVADGTITESDIKSGWP